MESTILNMAVVIVIILLLNKIHCSAVLYMKNLNLETKLSLKRGELCFMNAEIGLTYL